MRCRKPGDGAKGVCRTPGPGRPTHTLSGFLLSFLLWRYVVGPLYGIPRSATQELGVTMLFTVVSITRSYAWRRTFNARTP